jgi:hypothetical protein
MDYEDYAVREGAAPQGVTRPEEPSKDGPFRSHIVAA